MSLQTSEQTSRELCKRGTYTSSLSYRILTLGHTSSLWKALFIAYGGQYAFAAGLKVLQDLLAFSQPQFLRWMLRYISQYQKARFNHNNRPSNAEGFAIALIMFVTAIVQTICLNQVFSILPIKYH
jgi:hypothetical protein